MEIKRIEKFQMSPYFTASTLSHNSNEEGTHKSSKPTKVLRRSSSLLETRLMKKERSSKKSDDANVSLSVYPDGSSVNISVNETTLTATKSSLNATIGSFIISINCQESVDTHTSTKYYASPPPPEPSLVAVVTTYGYPLHVSLEDSPCVKATHSLSKFKVLLIQQSIIVIFSIQVQYIPIKMLILSPYTLMVKEPIIYQPTITITMWPLIQITTFKHYLQLKLIMLM